MTDDMQADLYPDDTVAAAGEDRLNYIRRIKGKKALTGDEKLAERLVYRRFFDTAVADRGATGVDGLLAALDDKRLEVSLLKPTITDKRTTEKNRKARERKKREEADRKKKAAKLHLDRRAGKAAPETEGGPIDGVRRRAESGLLPNLYLHATSLGVLLVVGMA
eukprot:jgi/Tetstr1/462045/TSEL_007116.t1